MEQRKRPKTVSERNKEIKKRNLLFVASVIAFIAFTGYFTHSYISTNGKIKTLEAELASKNEKKESLAKEKERLENELKEVDTDEFIEKVAREKLKMVSKDDLIYVDESKDKWEEYKKHSKKEDQGNLENLENLEKAEN